MPALALLAHQVFRRHAHVIQPHLVDVHIAVHGVDRLDRHAGAAHVDQQEGNTALRLALVTGAHQAEQPIGPLRVGGPDLLPGDQVMIAVAYRLGTQAGQVGTGTGFGIALGPERLGAEDARQETLLLRLAAEAVDHRADILDAERDDPRAALAGQFVLEDETLQRRPFLAAIGLWPMPGDPALGLQQAHPLHVVGLVQHLMTVGLVQQRLGHFLPAELADLFAQALRPLAYILVHGESLFRPGQHPGHTVYLANPRYLSRVRWWWRMRLSW